MIKLRFLLLFLKCDQVAGAACCQGSHELGCLYLLERFPGIGCAPGSRAGCRLSQAEKHLGQRLHLLGLILRSVVNSMGMKLSHGVAPEYYEATSQTSWLPIAIMIMVILCLRTCRKTLLLEGPWAAEKSWMIPNLTYYFGALGRHSGFIYSGLLSFGQRQFLMVDF